MATSPATIEQLARDSARTPDPETALRALSALRGELDELESELVGRALQAGASWSEIARAIGVSKQSAHHKHRHLAEQAFTAVSGGPKILVTSEARNAIQLAREEARRLGQPTLGTEHILLGILRCDNSPAMRALRALGVTHAATKELVQPTLTGATAPAASPRGPASEADGGVSRHARRVLEGSLREALKRQEGYIGVEHLLLALLADSRNGAVQTLETFKITPAQVRRQLEREWLSPTPSPTLRRGAGQDARAETAHDTNGG